MQAVNVLVHQGTVHLLDGVEVPLDALNNPGNPFEQLCQSLDPNVTYVNVLLPDHADDELYFALRDKGNELGIHVQSVAHRPEEIWEMWKYLQQEN